ncbi:MAG: hypothetical protein KI791_12920 [Cyclobacteriaceae bacterium]|nr:hypothetical protein [Cyclobacteriaceae bacterium SS2]
MKNFIIATAFILLFSFGSDINAKEESHSIKKEKKEKTFKKATKPPKFKKSKNKHSIPIDGGLAFFLLAAGATGAVALRNNKKVV